MLSNIKNVKKIQNAIQKYINLSYIIFDAVNNMNVRALSTLQLNSQRPLWVGSSRSLSFMNGSLLLMLTQTFREL